MKKMEDIEDKLRSQQKLDPTVKVLNMVEINRKELAGQREKVINEKIKGRF